MDTVRSRGIDELGIDDLDDMMWGNEPYLSAFWPFPRGRVGSRFILENVFGMKSVF